MENDEGPTKKKEIPSSKDDEDWPPPSLKVALSDASTVDLNESEDDGDGVVGEDEEDELSESFRDELLLNETVSTTDDVGYRTLKGGINGYSWMNAYKLPSDRASYIPYPGLSLHPDPTFLDFDPLVGSTTAASAACASTGVTSAMNPIELQVTNLDQTIDQREMKKVISNIFREHVNVLHVSVFFQSDGNMAACVRVPTIHDAQFAISQLHRKKVGYKRILISYSHSNQVHNPSILRSKVVSLLSEVPSGKLQLFKFREMFEKRYHNSVGVSDLYKMKDVVVITEEDTGRMVSLHPSRCLSALSSSTSSSSSNLRSAFFSSSNSSLASNGSSSNASAELDHPFCLRHTPKTDSKGWAEKENETQLPLVTIKLSVLAENMKILLKGHGGSAPLASLVTCYNADFEPPIQIDNENGVPMEHLISCVKGLVIHSGVTGVKKVSLIGDGEFESHKSSYIFASSLLLNNTPPPPAPLAGQLALFSRELVDLLKMSSGCRMLFHKFIPSYHHHFGRQCRVADYGYTKLKELFEALPHIVQILGEGSRAVITLSHRSQVKRFTSDLIRVLKAQASKQVTLGDLPILYEKEINRVFKISDYGVCYIQDILSEVSETSIVVSGEGEDTLISIPKREQTSDEVERTRQFSTECVELLRHAPDCRLPFNKFIPAYHHHFGRQCRVADYGFTKLIELFEAIPMTVEVTEDCDGERVLQLTDSERLIVIGEQIAALIRSSRRRYINVDEINDLYTAQYGYQLRPDNFGEKSIYDLLAKFNQLLRLEGSGSDMKVYLSDRSYVQALSLQVKALLAKKLEGRMTLKDFVKEYMEIYNVPLDLNQVKADLSEWIKVCEDEGGEDILCLTPIQLCTVKVQNLLKEHYGRLLFSEFEAAYFEKYNKILNPAVYGFPNTIALIQNLGETIALRGKGIRKMVVLLKDGLSNDRNVSVLTSSIPSPMTTTLTSSSQHQQPPHFATTRQPKPSPQSYSPGYPTRYSTLRQEGLRMYPRHNSYNHNYRNSPGMDFSPTSSNAKYNYLNELAQFGIYPPPDGTPRNAGNVFDSPGLGSSAQPHFIKQLSSPYGMTNTPPSRRSPRTESYYGYPLGSYKRSPDSLCGSASPTSSGQFTDDERTYGSQFTPSPIHPYRRCQPPPLQHHPLLRNNSAPSILGLKGSSPGKQQLYGSSPLAPIAVPVGSFPGGPSSPASPLSPGISFNPFQFPVTSAPSVFGYPGLVPSNNPSSQMSAASKSKLGSIFEESNDDFKMFPNTLHLTPK